MSTLKQTIKEKSEKQRMLKNQRKTINLVGERTIDSQRAASLHAINRDELRELFIAYAIVRGKDPLQSVSKRYYWGEKQVEKLIDQYKSEYETVRVDQ